ncbi:TetR/AcrR family transcriptional regulator [Acinetobacter rudis]|uniref:Helix-turn-helix domain-containing protein n=1 Tax=Acinetobacter rudis TaxID=632955 RepID=A0AAW8J7N7_9GAMM|nr:helix-turn-helix domain-containing protein [Acinetobacter rudis]MDQ8934585.1 helix-turn-helix domain-containing protein [Acinetobacter rudis]MDQ8951648.1 helix-turn-helix domain-containing protein [Acinetobacter rudis]MDQ9016845.1 helix-turn-helix domain-containing protein [Acinetobacter rudis]
MSKSAKKILCTAEQLFNQHSFVAVGVDLIRDQSGCSKTTLYTYYQNKQHLILAVLKQRHENFQHGLTTSVGQLTAQAALDAIFAWHIDWFQSEQFKGCLFVRAVAESDRNEQEIKAIAQEHKRWLRQFILQYCQNWVHANEIALLYFHQLEGLSSRFMVEGFDADVATQCKKQLDLIVNLLEQNK